MKELVIDIDKESRLVEILDDYESSFYNKNQSEAKQKVRNTYFTNVKDTVYRGKVVKSADIIYEDGTTDHMVFTNINKK